MDCTTVSSPERDLDSPFSSSIDMVKENEFTPNEIIRFDGYWKFLPNSSMDSIFWA